MSKSKIILFDADGVLALPEEFFCDMYAKSRGLDPASFDDFFKYEWKDYATGKKDIKDHIAAKPDLWKWDGTPDELMNYWCKTEDVRNEELIKLIHELRASGHRCYLATQQEMHRGTYMKNVMFPNLFDGYFITAEMELEKTDPEFFRAILEELKKQNDDLRPQEVLFFDDSQSKVDAAKAAGLDAVLFAGIDTVKDKLYISGR